MNTKNCRKFKGEIENCLKKRRSNFEFTIDSVFSELNFKTWLCKTNIIKRDSYHAYRFENMFDGKCTKIKAWTNVNYGTIKLTLLGAPSSPPFRDGY